jgi:hypothetical protein
MVTTLSIKHGSEHLPWPEQSQLEENERYLIRELRERITAYESRHGVASENLQTEVRSGRLLETADICDWLIDWELLRSLEDG